MSGGAVRSKRALADRQRGPKPTKSHQEQKKLVTRKTKSTEKGQNLVVWCFFPVAG